MLLGEATETPVVREIAEWIDLTVSEARGCSRRRARALAATSHAGDPLLRRRDQVRKLEEFDAQKIVRDGLAWLDAASRRKHGQGFNSVAPAEQLAIVESIADNRSDRCFDESGTLFFAYLKERVIDGFYTSRVGLDELGYRGNAFLCESAGLRTSVRMKMA